MEHFNMGPGTKSQSSYIPGKILMGDNNNPPYINVDANFLSNCDPYSCSVTVSKNTCRPEPISGGSNYHCNLICKSCKCKLDKNNNNKCYPSSTNDNPVIVPITYRNNKMNILPSNGDKQKCITINAQKPQELTTDPSRVKLNTCTNTLLRSLQDNIARSEATDARNASLVSIVTPEERIRSVVIPEERIGSVVTPEERIGSVVTPEERIGSVVTPEERIRSVVTPEERIGSAPVVTPEEQKVSIEGFMQNPLNFAPVYTDFPQFSQKMVFKNYWF